MNAQHSEWKQPPPKFKIYVKSEHWGQRRVQQISRYKNYFFQMEERESDFSKAMLEAKRQ